MFVDTFGARIFSLRLVYIILLNYSGEAFNLRLQPFIVVFMISQILDNFFSELALSNFLVFLSAYVVYDFSSFTLGYK